ncbi:hypothetical protein AKH05_15470 [Vibrio parahaemolyticus]|nr:hypothetical protein [Vibrio parahaemolyticus]EKA4470050.1 hypothetical protein [Vibrio parahaemolyticus]OCP57260.1 hypothetical protein AKH05_15470 [Vibrio parahaemolyticus]
MSLVHFNEEAKVALSWYRKAMMFISKTKLRVSIVSIFLVVVIFFLPKLYALFLSKSIFQHNEPHYESSELFYKKLSYLYLIDLLDACIKTQPEDKLKSHYCAKAEEHYRYKVDKKHMVDVEQTIKLKAYLVMKADAKFMLNRLGIKDIELQHPKKVMPDFKFIFVWWFEVLSLLVAVLVGGMFYLSASRTSKET